MKIHPSLLIIHGLFGSSDNWATLARKWSENYHVICIDLRNHGRSFHSEDMRFEAMNEDILSVLHRESIVISHILGHSLGGKVAMEFAGAYPESVNKLIIADVAPYPYSIRHAGVIELLKNIFPEDYGSRREIETDIRRCLDAEILVQFMSKNIERIENGDGFKWKFNAKILIRDYDYLISRVVQKGFLGDVLFIGGDKSDYITRETSLHILNLYPRYSLEYVGNAGHWLHVDNPEEFYTRVKDFLE